MRVSRLAGDVRRDALRLARRTLSTIKGNLFWAVTAATNDFTNSGGDGYTMLADYLKEVGTVSPVTEGRITRLN